MQRAKVYLAGAGPGDPELLTVKAARILRKADAVIYDRLVSAELLALANPNAIFIYARKAQGQQEPCPHGGGPLAGGLVGGATVTCPLHSWRICLESGEVQRPCESAAPAVRTYRTKVEDGIVMLAADDVRSAQHAAW